MDKKSFSFLVTAVAVSMVIIGTFKIARKKSHSVKTPVSVGTKVPAK